MSSYLLLLRNSGRTPLTPEQKQSLTADYARWVDALGDGLIGSGKLTSGEGRVIHGAERVVTDGPFCELKEVVGGYWLIKADDYQQAVKIGKNLPFGSGQLEIREIETPH